MPDIERNQFFMCRIQADDRRTLVNALHQMAKDLERGELTAGVSGGYSDGSIYAYRENPGVTHDSYFSELERMLEAEKARASATA